MIYLDFYRQSSTLGLLFLPQLSINILFSSSNLYLLRPTHSVNSQVLTFQCRHSFDATRRSEATKDLLRRNRSVRHDGRASPTKNVALRMSIIHVVTFVTCWTPYLVSDVTIDAPLHRRLVVKLDKWL